MTQEEFSSSLDKTSIKPVLRTKIGGDDVFIADGFVQPWQYHIFDRFGVSPTMKEFPFGCFATLWYAHRNISPCGLEFSKRYVQSERITAILERAKTDLAKERKARLNG